MRLDLVIAANTRGKGKKECAALIKSGVVQVDGQTVTIPGYQVLLGGVETVTVDGVALPADLGFHRVVIVHKPAGVVCTRDRGGESWNRAHGAQAEAAPKKCRPEKRSIYDVLADGYPSLDHPSLGAFGRLDKDTTGLYLLGTDGGLQLLLMHPSSHFVKSYIANLDTSTHQLCADAAARFQSGVTLANGTLCEPAELVVLATDKCGAASVVRVRLHEGRYHQVKRMLAACGGHVRGLHREAIGPLQLGDLAVGQARELTIEELLALKAGLPFEVRCAVVEQQTETLRNRGPPVAAAACWPRWWPYLADWLPCCSFGPG